MRTSYRTLTPFLFTALVVTGCESTEITAPEEEARYSLAMSAVVPGTRESAQQQANFNAKPNAHANPNAHTAAGGKGKGADKDRGKNPPQNQPPSSGSPSGSEVSDPPVVNQPSAPATANPLVDLDFTKARTRAEALAMLTAAGGKVHLHSAGGRVPLPVSPLDLVGFRLGEGLVMLQPKSTSVTPYIRFDALGARPGLWQLVERKFSPGWTNDGEPGPAPGYKVDGIGWAGGDGSARISTAGGGYYLTNGFVPANSGGHPPMEGLLPGRYVERDAGKVGDEWSGARFHRYVMYYHAQGRRGTFIGFLDGRLLADASGTYLTINAPLVNRSSAGMNFNRIRYKDQSITIRRITILDSRAHPNPWGLLR